VGEGLEPAEDETLQPHPPDSPCRDAPPSTSGVFRERPPQDVGAIFRSALALTAAAAPRAEAQRRANPTAGTSGVMTGMRSEARATAQRLPAPTARRRAAWGRRGLARRGGGRSATTRAGPLPAGATAGAVPGLRDGPDGCAAGPGW